MFHCWKNENFWSLSLIFNEKHLVPGWQTRLLRAVTTSGNYKMTERGKKKKEKKRRASARLTLCVFVQGYKGTSTGACAESSVITASIWKENWRRMEVRKEEIAIKTRNEFQNNIWMGTLQNTFRGEKVAFVLIWKNSQKPLVQAWGWLMSYELEEVCPLPGKQVNLSKSEFHFDTSHNVHYIKYNWKKNQSKSKQDKQAEQSPTKWNYSSSNN